MNRISRELRSETGTQIRLVRDADDLCGACPEKEGTRCRSEKPSLYDQRVLTHSRHHYGDVLRWQDFRDEMMVLATTVRADICGDCQWSDFCSSVDPQPDCVPDPSETESAEHRADPVSGNPAGFERAGS